MDDEFDFTAEPTMIDDIEIVTRVGLGGLEGSIEAKGIPEQMGKPIFQITFYETPGATSLVSPEDISIEEIFNRVQMFVESTAQRAIDGQYDVPEDIVDQGGDDDAAEEEKP